MKHHNSTTIGSLFSRGARAISSFKGKKGTFIKEWEMGGHPGKSSVKDSQMIFTLCNSKRIHREHEEGENTVPLHMVSQGTGIFLE
jgi:hypothetical protein